MLSHLCYDKTFSVKQTTYRFALLSYRPINAGFTFLPVSSEEAESWCKVWRNLIQNAADFVL